MPRVSTGEGPKENKETTANLIIISHLFRKLMWSRRCQDALFSLSFCSLPFLIYPSSPPILSFLCAICPGSALTQRGFDEILSRLYVSVWNVIFRSDVSETRPVISLGSLNFISFLFRFKSAFTIAQCNHIWLPGILAT